MAFVDFRKSRSERVAPAARPSLTPTRGDASQRARSGTRLVREILATFSVLVLIMISALAVRFLLSLTIGVVK